MAAIAIQGCVSVTAIPMPEIVYNSGKVAKGCTLVIETKHAGEVEIDLFAGREEGNFYNVLFDFSRCEVEVQT